MNTNNELQNYIAKFNEVLTNMLKANRIDAYSYPILASDKNILSNQMDKLKEIMEDIDQYQEQAEIENHSYKQGKTEKEHKLAVLVAKKGIDEQKYHLLRQQINTLQKRASKASKDLLNLNHEIIYLRTDIESEEKA